MTVRRLAFPVAICLGAASAAAQVPRLVGYQGRLLRSDGTAATGTAGVSFSVWDSATGGSRLWNETQTLGLSDGYYATFLGLATATPDGLFDGPARWVEIQVGGETLAPRQQTGAVPYSLTAQSIVGSASVSALRVGGQTVVGADGRLAGPARYTAGAGIAIDASQTVSLSPCTAGQTLAHDATSWFCAPHNAGTVTSVGAAAPLTVTATTSAPQLSIAQAGASSSGFLSSADWNTFSAKYGTGMQSGGDLSGPMSAPSVVRLQSRAVSAAAPAAGQVLRWSAGTTQWEPGADVFTNVTASAPLTAQGSGSTSVQLSVLQAGRDQDGYLSSIDWAAFDAKAEKICSGDLSGSLPSPTVVALQSRAVADDEPQPGQVLYWDGTAWRPETLAISDVTGLSSGYLALTGDQTISGAKTFTTPLGVASGGTGRATAGEHTVFAGPLSGTGAPDFRGLDATDIPSLDAAKIATGTLGVAHGGTGAAAFAAGGVLFGGGTNAVGASAAGTSGQILVSGGSDAPTWTSQIGQSAVTNLSTDLGNRPTGSGTAGYLARWTAAGALGTGAAYDTGENVGIGRPYAGYTLDVYGADSAYSGIRVDTAGYANVPATLGSANGVILNARGLNVVSDNATLASGPSSGVGIAVDRTGPALSVRNAGGFAALFEAGNVGIGTTAPTSTLDVAGAATPQITARTTSDTAAGNVRVLGSDATKMLDLLSNGPSVTGNWFSSNPRANSAIISTNYSASGGNVQSMQLGTVEAAALILGTNSAERMRIAPDGKVGIGTTSPLATLHVDGDIRTSGTVKGNRFQRLDFSGRLKTWQIFSFDAAYTGSYNSEFLEITIHDSVQYDYDGGTQVIVKRDGTGYARRYGETHSTWNVRLKTYLDGTTVNGYLVADDYCDTYTLEVEYNRTNTTLTQTDKGSDTFVPPGTLLFDSATGIWIENGLRSFSGSIGVGTTAPALPLQVSGIRNYPATTGTVQNGILALHGDGTGLMNAGVVPGGGGWLQVTDDRDLSINYKLMLNPNGGSVGIGTTNPGAPLHVNGAVKLGEQHYVKSYALAGSTITNSTIDIVTGDGNSMFDVVYVSQHYDAGAGTSGWRYVRWHGYDGSGGSGEGAGANFFMTVVQSSGTGESSHTPTWSTVGGKYRLTYGNGYMSYRNLVVRVYAGDGIPLLE